MNKEYTMSRILKSDWRKLKALAKKERRSQIAIFSLALDYYGKRIKE